MAAGSPKIYSQLYILLIFLGIGQQLHGQYSETELNVFIQPHQHDTTKVIGYVELAKLYRKDTPEKAIFYIDKAESLIEIKLSKGTKYRDFYLNRLAMVYNVSGVVYRRLGNYPEALRHYKKALKLLEKLDNKKVQSSTLFNIGKLYRIEGNIQESLKYFKQSEALRKRIKDTAGLINCYEEIGIIRYEEGGYLPAISNYKMGIQLAAKLEDKEKLFSLYAKQSDAYLQLNEYSIVKDSLSNALAILYPYSSAYPTSMALIAIPYSKALYALGDVQSGVDIVNKAIKAVERLDAVVELSELYRAAAEGHQLLGNYQKAVHYLNLRIQIDSTRIVNSNAAEAVRIEMHYLSKKQRVADSLKLLDEKEISRLKLRQKNEAIKAGTYRIIGLTLGLILLVITGFFMYRNYRLKRKALETKKKDVESLSLKIKRESDWIDHLIDLNDKIKKNQVENTSEKIQELVNSMRDNLIVDKHRQVQAKNIEIVNNEFRDKLKSRYPSLTKTEIEMCELIRLELSNSEISRIRNISQNSARMARYRLKKKLNLKEDQSLYQALKEV